jgi:hypothetical protein
MSSMFAFAARSNMQMLLNFKLQTLVLKFQILKFQMLWISSSKKSHSQRYFLKVFKLIIILQNQRKTYFSLVLLSSWLFAADYFIGY